ncbi:uncharacterized protein LOC135843159 [Planococcus citri]|uniref:uncharacterized protein LOC135843159 n=1 Tax=Planococcus citri TaxID=170843 RepID=UPI0031F8F102
MIEIVDNVYDIVYPSPQSLRDISAIAVAVQLWRLHFSEYIENNIVFYRSLESVPDISLRKIIPNVPIVIDYLCRHYAKKLIYTTKYWIGFHFNFIFRHCRSDQIDILNDFKDIVGDFDGSIHFVRTAQRMMRCDRISQEEKFAIACVYCFEDDIRRIWPTMSDKTNLDELILYNCHLYYWVCCLRNELNKIPDMIGIPVNDRMLDLTTSYTTSSFDYFWSRASLECRYSNAIYLAINRYTPFCGRFVLSKLNELQLNEFITQNGGDMIFYTLTSKVHTHYVLPIWMYIKDRIDETNFISIIERMLPIERDYRYVDDPLIEKSEYALKYHNNTDVTVCCEIWRLARPTLKRSVIQNLLPNIRMYRRYGIQPNCPREVRLLITILLDATAEERSAFWRKHWLHLLISTRVADLHRIMKLCFVNDSEINQYKTNTMAKYENLRYTINDFFTYGFLKELSSILDFCCVDIRSSNELKRRYLERNVLGKYTSLSICVICKKEAFQELIDVAYDGNTHLANEFRSKFVSWPETEQRLLWYIRKGYFRKVKEFVDSFASYCQNVDRLKKRFVEKLKTYLIEGSIWLYDAKYLQEFLVWNLGDEDVVTKFKQSILPDDVLRNMIRKLNKKYYYDEYDDEEDDEDYQCDEYDEFEDDYENDVPEQFANLLTYRRCIDNFLLCYFCTPEKIDEFKSRLADVFKMM